MVPMHPEKVPNHPGELRWVVPAGVLTDTGRAAGVPGALAALLDDGTLARITVEPTAVVTRLGEDRGWSREGARVRTALHTALDDPAGWVMTAEADGTGETGDGLRAREDALIHATTQELLAGHVGDFARGHGGTIELVDVSDRVVTVRLGGSCHGCPAAWFTLHMRLERHLRKRHPELREVRDVGGGATFTGFGTR